MSKQFAISTGKFTLAKNILEQYKRLSFYKMLKLLMLKFISMKQYKVA